MCGIKIKFILLVSLGFILLSPTCKKESGLTEGNRYFESLSVSNDVDYWDMVTVQNDPKIIYQSEENIPQVLKDTFVENGFSTFCPPAHCFWYYRVLLKTGEIKFLTDTSELNLLIPRVKNIHDAAFYVEHYPMGHSYDLPDPIDLPELNYQENSLGFTISERKRISDCPVTMGTITFIITRRANISIQDTINIKEETGCI